MLVHVNTGMHLTASTQEGVRLQPTLGSGAYFLVEPRYKLRSEGEKVFALDHVVLQSRRFAGAFLHSRKLAPLEGGDGMASATEAASPRTSAWGGNQPPERAGGGSPDADAPPQGVDQEVDLHTRSSRGEGWVVHRFASARSSETEEDALRGGDYVRLFHREDEGCVYIYTHIHGTIILLSPSIPHIYQSVSQSVSHHTPSRKHMALTHTYMTTTTTPLDTATHRLLLGTTCLATTLLTTDHRYMVSTLNTDQLRAQNYPLDEILAKAAEATRTLDPDH